MIKELAVGGIVTAKNRGLSGDVSFRKNPSVAMLPQDSYPCRIFGFQRAAATFPKGRSQGGWLEKPKTIIAHVV
jgi:hypothetical protein